MKKLVMAIVALSVGAPALAQSVYVKGYTKRDGTYVAPSYRTRPDSSIYNNYSTRPNVNPYTGNAGTRNPYSSPSFSPYYKPYTAPCYYNCK